MSEVLLKDMPEHAERVEGNYSLIGKVAEEIKRRAKFDKTEHGDTYINNLEDVAGFVVDEMADFVNDNYTWKGELAR